MQQPPTERTALADRLKEAREYVGFSQDEVARKLNIPRTAVSLIESGQRRVEAIELQVLAKLYQRSIGSLTGEEPPPELPQDIAHLARTASKLTDTDRTELRRFAEFLSNRSPREAAK